MQFLIKNISELKSLAESKPYQFIDCTYYLPNETKIPFSQSPKINFDDIFFCVDSVADTHSSFGHTFPPKSIFLDYCQKNNITQEKNYIFYDHKGVFSSPRVFLTFLAYGFNNIYILDGGYPAIDAFKYELKNNIQPTIKTVIKSIENEPLELFVKHNYVDNAIGNKNYKIIDARPTGRFLGTAPEPRAGLLSGHIPTSINLPFADVLTMEKTFKSLDEVKLIFDRLGITPQDTLVFSCGSGITACVVAFAALMIGFDINQIKIYDASWCEWGNGHFPIEKD